MAWRRKERPWRKRREEASRINGRDRKSDRKSVFKFRRINISPSFDHWSIRSTNSAAEDDEKMLNYGSSLVGVGSFALDVESSSGISVKMVDRKHTAPLRLSELWRGGFSLAGVWNLNVSKIAIFRYFLYLFAFRSLLFFLSHLSLDLKMRMPEKWWNQKFLSVIPITTIIFYSFYLHKQIRL